jgi:hypothetical protein
MPVQTIQLTEDCIEVVEQIQRHCQLGTTRLIEGILETSLDPLPFGAVKPFLVRGIHVATNYKKSLRIALSHKNKSNLRASAGAYGFRQGDVVQLLVQNYYEDHIEEWKEHERKFPRSESDQIQIPY